ncbi:MAG TPA: hypothetical protein VJB15_03460 [Rhodothermia bacterium]|nr:hypothetical protein [Rhodothermia bacterium]
MTQLMINGPPRRRVKAFAAAVATAAQLFLSAAAFAEVRFGPDVQAHVEAAGTSLHHAHDEANCAACVSQHILSTAEPGRTARFAIVTSAAHPAAAELRADSGAQLFFARSRAPPTTPV